jgi:hypothetical protein
LTFDIIRIPDDLKVKGEVLSAHYAIVQQLIAAVAVATVKQCRLNSSQSHKQ